MMMSNYGNNNNSNKEITPYPYGLEQEEKRPSRMKILIGSLILALSIIGIVCLLTFGKSPKEKGKKKTVDDDLNNAPLYEEATEHDIIRGTGVKADFNPKTFEDQIKSDTFVEAVDLTTKWEDIAGNDRAKRALVEGLVWPMQNPAIFKGARRPPRGVLLFGPPGTGKTMLARAVATNLKIAFYNASGSTFTAKYYGESERLVKALFKLARAQPSAVIFIDEIDSFLGTRGRMDETDATRRVKTEFMVQMDGLVSNQGRILVIAATNRPQDLDEAILRRFNKRIKVGLPDQAARVTLLSRCLGDISSNITPGDWSRIVQMFEGKCASGKDLEIVCEYAAMQPIRRMMEYVEDIQTISPEQVPPVTVQDFEEGFSASKPSLSIENVQELDQWEELHAAL